MTPFENQILIAVKESLGADYRQDKNSFYKFYPEFFNVIWVQFVKIGLNPTDKAITVYFGVNVPRILELLWGNNFKQDTAMKLSAMDGVFNCNINDLILDFKGKPKIKYWDLNKDLNPIEEISDVVRSKLVPFVKQFDSLVHLNDMIDRLDYPAKQSTDVPVKIAALKFILGKNDEFNKLADQLRAGKNHFLDMLEKLIENNSHKPF